MSPAEKGQITKLVNRGLELNELLKAFDEELKEIKGQLGEAASVHFSAGEKTVLLAGGQGTCQVQRAEVVSLDAGQASWIREHHPEAYSDLVNEVISYKPSDFLKSSRPVGVMDHVSVKVIDRFTFRAVAG